MRKKLNVRRAATHRADAFANIDVEKTGKIHDVSSNTLYLDGVIDEWFGIGPLDVRDALQELDRSRELRVVIHSPGGYVYEAIDIHNQLAEWPSSVTTHVTAYAASAATVIAQVGDHRTIADNADYMIHRAWTMCIGNSARMAAEAEYLREIDAKLAKMYEAKSKLDPATLNALLIGEDGRDGTTMSAATALEYGFVDEILSTERPGGESDEPEEGAQGSTYRLRSRAKVQLATVAARRNGAK